MFWILEVFVHDDLKRWFPEILATTMGAPIIRIIVIVYLSLYWGPPVLEQVHAVSYIRFVGLWACGLGFRA